jgi:hypothetical protein
MPTLEIPPSELLERLFRLVAEEDETLLEECRWLVLGAKLAAAVALPGKAPDLGQLVSLLRLLRHRAPALEPLGRKLAGNSQHCEDALVEIAVDQLLEHADWEHPTQVLERPLPDFHKLFIASRSRVEDAGDGERSAVESMSSKMERAWRIAEGARVRRERMQGGRRPG